MRRWKAQPTEAAFDGNEPTLSGAQVIQARPRNRLPLPQPAAVHVRRSYSECRNGQIHLVAAYPSGGGFDERTALVCLHHAGGSSRLFSPMLRDLGLDRSIYAPDLPGHGSSDAPGGKYSVADLAGAVGDFIDGLRLRTVDLVGHQLGAQLAAELAIARPQQIRRVILWGMPMFSPQDRSALLGQGALGSRDDGADVASAWQRMLDQRGPGASMGALVDEFADQLRAGAHGAKALAAAIDYPAAERLPLLKQPTLVLRPRDEFWDVAPRVRAMLSNCTLLDLPEHGQGFLSAAPQRFASLAKEFLDR
jgi:pimeloyl-ACP methyl ester carboxylesterase